MNKNYIDITKEMLKNTNSYNYEVKELWYYKDKNGTKYYVDNINVVLDYSLKEKEMALFIIKTFGGRLYLLPKVNKPDGIKTADYLWNNTHWDLKSINGNGKNIFFHAIEDHERQAHNFIFDITNSKMSEYEILQRLNKLYSIKKVNWLEKIIIVKNKNIIIVAKKSSPSD